MSRILEECLQTTVASEADLVQLRRQSRTITTCTVRNGIVEDFSSMSLRGVGIRTLVDSKSWGFSSTNIIDSESLRNALKISLKLAKASANARNEEIHLEPAKARVADVSATGKRPPLKMSPDEIAEIPLEAYRGANEVKQVVDVKATYVSIEDDKYFLDSEEVQIHQKTNRVQLFVDVIAKENGQMCPASENIGHTGGLEIFDTVPPFHLGRSVAQDAARLLKAKAPPSGKFQVVIHPTLCATLLHEAIGHPLEADLAMTGGGFGERIGQLVSSKLITIYDDGRVKNGLGYLPFDDEGVESKRTVLIEKGVLESFMHDRTSAALSGSTPSGNSHAWDYSVEPLIRQTNIGIEEGDYSEEEMLEEVKEGIFLEGTFGGQADSNADFTFGFQKAQSIKHGELGEEFRGANVAGNAVDVFKTVDAVGKEAVLRPGACGKYQFAVQGRIVPSIRCEILVGGSGG
ncbi:MAG: TldD/PmbA family protein [Candidatus Bathyarchaeota archaeon]|nr:MAG: TldD/PmbA family protein [Candidatus Bathyarchaeota archaeon]